MLAPYANASGTGAIWPRVRAAPSGSMPSASQSFVRATGGRGLRTVLDGLQAARRAHGPRDARHRSLPVNPYPQPRFAGCQTGGRRLRAGSLLRRPSLRGPARSASAQPSPSFASRGPCSASPVPAPCSLFQQQIASSTRSNQLLPPLPRAGLRGPSIMEHRRNPRPRQPFLAVSHLHRVLPQLTEHNRRHPAQPRCSTNSDCPVRGRAPDPRTAEVPAPPSPTPSSAAGVSSTAQA